jgi:hypothetical protein
MHSDTQVLATYIGEDMVALVLMIRDRVTSPIKAFHEVLESPGAIWRAMSTRKLHLWWLVTTCHDSPPRTSLIPR